MHLWCQSLPAESFSNWLLPPQNQSKWLIIGTAGGVGGQEDTADIAFWQSSLTCFVQLWFFIFTYNCVYLAILTITMWGPASQNHKGHNSMIFLKTFGHGRVRYLFLLTLNIIIWTFYNEMLNPNYHHAATVPLCFGNTVQRYNLPQP